MKLTLAKTAGFCYGVKRAVELAQDCAGGTQPCVMLGPIIHNQAVIDRLESLGVGLAERPEDVQPGRSVILRSHGEGPETYEALKRQGPISSTPPAPTLPESTPWCVRPRGGDGGSSSSAPPTITRSAPSPAGAGTP